MIDSLNTLLYLVHTIASVYWIGGITFNLLILILIPKAKQILGKEASQLLGATSKTFKLHVNICIIIFMLIK